MKGAIAFHLDGLKHQHIPIYNVSVADESYRLVNAPTVIDLADV
jgi:hypothetical protein